MNLTRTARALSLLLSLTALGFVAGCPKSQGTFVVGPAPVGAPVDVDGDAASLMPAGTLMAGYLAVGQIANSSVGGDVLAISEKMLPFAAQIDFQVKRDLDHAYIGLYSFSGSDWFTVMRGSFKPDKIEAAAQQGLNTPYGTVVASTYAGRKLYTVANNGFCVLSPKTALFGTEAAIRRALDRIQAGTVKREMAPWMADWVSQPGYAVLIASDVNKQSFGKTATSYMPWIQGVQYVRVRGRFNPDGSFGASGALTYPDEAKAQAAAQGLDGLKKSLVVMSVAKVIGVDPLVRNLTGQAAGKDAQFQVVLDEKQMRQLIGVLGGWAVGGVPAVPPPSSAPAPAGSGKGTNI